MGGGASAAFTDELGSLAADTIGSGGAWATLATLAGVLGPLAAGTMAGGSPLAWVPWLVRKT